MGRGAAVVLMTMAVALSGLALEGPPLTEVIYGSTAYTLPAGTWELTGYLSLPAILPSVSISYGVTDALQMGTGLSVDPLGFLNLGAKLALALPVSLAYPLAESMLYLVAGCSMGIGGCRFGCGQARKAASNFAFWLLRAGDGLGR